MHVLIEDDVETADQVPDRLRRAGHSVECVADGRDGLIKASANHYDAIVIDWMLPGLDGLALVKTLRERAIRTPVLFLTALGGLDDRVEGLNAGGDDYLTKPFEYPEFFARLNAITRRPPLAGWEPVLRVADLELDRINRRVTRANKNMDLSPLEFRLFEYLMRNGECPLWVKGRSRHHRPLSARNAIAMPSVYWWRVTLSEDMVTYIMLS